MPFYYAVYERFRTETIKSKSKFITTLIPVDDRDDAERKLSELRKEYSDATHNCYAYVSNESATELRFGDDGEPQGTAGLPMLDVMRKRNICKTLAVVTRYFGGVKLGANGLIGAYTECIATALNNADVRKYRLSRIFEISVDYNSEKKMSSLIDNYGKEISRVYTDKIGLVVSVPIENCGEFAAKFSDVNRGNGIMTEKETETFVDYE